MRLHSSCEMIMKNSSTFCAIALRPSKKHKAGNFSVLMHIKWFKTTKDFHDPLLRTFCSFNKKLIFSFCVSQSCNSMMKMLLRLMPDGEWFLSCFVFIEVVMKIIFSQFPSSFLLNGKLSSQFGWSEKQENRSSSLFSGVKMFGAKNFRLVFHHSHACIYVFSLCFRPFIKTFRNFVKVFCSMLRFLAFFAAHFPSLCAWSRFFSAGFSNFQIVNRIFADEVFHEVVFTNAPKLKRAHETLLDLKVDSSCKWTFFCALIVQTLISSARSS